MLKNFSNALYASILSSFYRTGSNHFDIVFKKGIFSLGILWSTFKQLIIISGISFVFSVGLKGSGLQIEYLFFNLLLWFLFAEITNTTISLPINTSLLSQNNSNAFTYILGHIFRIVIQYYLLLFLSFMIFFIFNLEVYHIDIIRGFIFMSFVSIIYAVLMSALLHAKTFLIEIHGFFMQALFFASASVIPISIIPNPIRDILLINPIVHIQEYIKFNITGIQLEYISLSNAITFILFGIFFLLPALHYKNNKFNQELNVE